MLRIYHYLTCDFHHFQCGLWRAFITRTSSRIWPIWLDNACLDELAFAELNGRQIMNTICTAQALALSKNRALTQDDIYMPPRVMETFDNDVD
jgi:hypothetical protein